MHHSAISLLNSNHYQVYNREIAKKLKSVNAAIMLSELINRHEYHSAKDELIYIKETSGWFYYTIDLCEDRTALSRKEQATAVKILKKHELVDQKNFGLPQKRHFKINENKILEFFGLSNNVYKMSQTDKLEMPNGTNCNVRKGQTAPYIYKELHKEPKERKRKNSDSVAFQADAFKLFAFFYECVKKIDKKFVCSEKSKSAWLNELDKMQRLDKRTWKEIESMIKFVFDPESWWYGKVLSPKKLRKLQTQIVVSMKEQSYKKEKTTNLLDEKHKRIEQNREKCRKIVKKYDLPSRALEVSDFCVHVKIGAAWTAIEYKENGFLEQFENALRKAELI